MKKLLPINLLLICLLSLVVLWWLFPISQFLSAPATFIGLIPLAGGLLITVLGEKQFKDAGTNIKTFNDPDILVKDGVFKYSRNPMYLGLVLVLLGVAVLLGSISSLAVVVAFFAITDRWYIRYEEGAMARRFGEEYEAYKAQTRRWL
jgi:protein-S-isoprenylcysteine O-methyltransferase Ste14